MAILLFNKPFRVLSQFTNDDGKPTLKDYINLPNFYPAGRLDYDSEGLMALTDDGKMQEQIASPKHQISKQYFAQVEGNITAQFINILQDGVKLKDGITKPAKCRIVAEPYFLEPRNPPIRVRKNIPDCWISLSISEGKNRQIRRMCAAVGFPVLRLIRYRIGSWTLDGLKAGEYKRLE